MTKRTGPPSRDTLLREVLTAFDSTPIVEAYIRDDEFHIAGCRDGDRVILNPAPDTCDALIHELVHKIHPTWTESYVIRRAWTVFRKMSDEEIRSLYRKYQARKRTGRPVQLYRRPAV